MFVLYVCLFLQHLLIGRCVYVVLYIILYYMISYHIILYYIIWYIILLMICCMFAYSYSAYLLASNVGSHSWQECPWPVTGHYSWSSVINLRGETFFVFERKIMMRSMIMVQRGSSVMAFTEDFIWSSVLNVFRGERKISKLLLFICNQYLPFQGGKIILFGSTEAPSVVRKQRIEGA